MNNLGSWIETFWDLMISHNGQRSTSTLFATMPMEWCNFTHYNIAVPYVYQLIAKIRDLSQVDRLRAAELLLIPWYTPVVQDTHKAISHFSS